MTSIADNSTATATGTIIGPVRLATEGEHTFYARITFTDPLPLHPGESAYRLELSRLDPASADFHRASAAFFRVDHSCLSPNATFLPSTAQFFPRGQVAALRAAWPTLFQPSIIGRQVRERKKLLYEALRNSENDLVAPIMRIREFVDEVQGTEYFEEAKAGLGRWLIPAAADLSTTRDVWENPEVINNIASLSDTQGNFGRLVRSRGFNDFVGPDNYNTDQLQREIEEREEMVERTRLDQQEEAALMRLMGFGAL